MSPADILPKAGLALYGLHWRGRLAKALGVNPRTLSRWIDGHSEPPRDLYGRLLALTLKETHRVVHENTLRMNDLDDVVYALKRHEV